MALGLFLDIATGLPWTPNGVGSLEPMGCCIFLPGAHYLTINSPDGADSSLNKLLLYSSPLSPPHIYKVTPNHFTLMFHMPKSSQPTTPHHLSHALKTQKTVQDLTSLPILQRHSTHPTHHHTLDSFQAMQILSLHCPCLSPICQYTLDTCPKNHSLPVIWCTTGCHINWMNQWMSQ